MIHTAFPDKHGKPCDHVVHYTYATCTRIYDGRAWRVKVYE